MQGTPEEQINLTNRYQKNAKVHLLIGMDAEFLHAYTREWFDYSERRMTSAIRALPDGEIVVHSRHDPFPGVPDGVPLTAGLRVSKEEGRLEVDLRDNPDCQPCGLNLTEATARTSAMLGVFNAIGGDVPPNGGSFRRLRVHLRENCVVGIPRHPVSCSVATTNLADRVANMVQRAFAEFSAGAGLAEAGLTIPAAWGVISGTDVRAGSQEFVNQLILAACTGGPGAPGADGWLTLAGLATPAWSSGTASSWMSFAFPSGSTPSIWPWTRKEPDGIGVPPAPTSSMGRLTLRFRCSTPATGRSIPRSAHEAATRAHGRSNTARPPRPDA